MKNCPNQLLIGLLMVGIMNSTNLFAKNTALNLSNSHLFVDADGDGDPSETDPDDNNPCIYDSSTQVIGDVSAEWLALDCDGDTLTNEDEIALGTDEQDPDTDGDGDPDNTDTNPFDNCVYSENRVEGVGSPAWNISDCDGDGVPNGEDSNPVSDDADGDGDKDATDPDDTDPCIYSENRVAADATEEWNAADCDNDGLSNGEEVAAGTDEQNPDTDGDGDLDGTDTAPLDNCTYSENQDPANADATWNAADCDNDGSTNGAEIAAGTDEQNPDTDGDGDLDGTDTDPLDNCTYSENQDPANADATWNAADCDNDGSTNGAEIAAGTDEQNPDTDGDGDLDGTDTDPLDNCVYSENQDPANADAAWNAADCDNDGSTNGAEIAAGTDEQNPDTDGDGDLDGTDTDPLNNCVYSENQDPANADATWNAADCDNDGSTNGAEIAAGTDEQNPDTDGDGDLDGTDTDPLNNCVYSENQDPANADATWNAADCDNDGSTNGDEIAAGTDEQNPDTDGDGDLDGTDTDPLDNCVYSENQDPANADAAWNAADCDNDGSTNGDEIAAGTDEQNPDTDGDGDLDGTDTDPLDNCVYSENQDPANADATWNAADCDNDGSTNGDEIAAGTDEQNPDTDGDGDLDGTDTDPLDNCVYSENQDPANADATWNAADCDNDGSTNGDEIAAGTDEQNPDTDGDGDLDGTDTDPLNNCVYSENQDPANADATWNAADCDNDGSTNGDEIAAGTDEQNPDTDGDGDLDGTDTDPLNNCVYSENQDPANADATWNAADCDNDGSTNGAEIAAGTDEQNPDTDGDGDLDGTDTDPLNNCVYSENQDPANADAAWNAADCDNDGSTNGAEIAAGTDEQNPDTDGDGDLDGTDTDPLNNCVYSENQDPANADATWNAADCDNDGSTNGDEIAAGTDEQNPDTDGDGDLDGTDTDPLDNCVYSENQDPANADAAWNAADCDNDGSTNGDEIAAGTDEQNPDTDGDGDLDGVDTDPLNNCVYSENQDPANADATWNAADCDNDGSTNGAEIAAGTDEQNPDTDGDGDLDGTDTDPLNNCVYSENQDPANADAAWNAADCDNDGSTNGDEIAAGTDEQNPDTDGDGDLDGVDTDPLNNCVYSENQDPANADATWNAADCDNDGSTNGAEIAAGTDEQNPDTDGDGDLDGTDTDPLNNCVYSENQDPANADAAWNAADCDNDGSTNGDEIAAGTDEQNPDTDGDGDLDGTDTDPLNNCVYSENQDPANADAAWNAADCDNDGSTNGDEIAAGTDEQNPDTDGDGDLDGVDTDPLNNCVYSENQDPANADAAWNAADCDNDGSTNGDEIAAGTDEQNPDTDGDGDLDGTDTDPLNNCVYSENQDPANADAAWNAADCDNDGSTNGDEIAAGTDEQNPDTDGDGDLDGTDTDPLNNCVYSENQDPANADAAWNAADCDNDGSTNGDEIAAGTDEQNPDTDGDGDLDGTDTDPLNNCVYSENQDPANADAAWNAADCDNDGSTNGAEIAAGTDEQNPDTDGDGDLDGTDTDPLNNCVYSENQDPANADAAWNAADCDGDFVSNGDEVNAGTDPQNPDTDGDGDRDGTDTDPLDPCAYSSNQNTNEATEAWNAADCDGDTISNGQEVIDGTNPIKADTDGDGDNDNTDPDPLDLCVWGETQVIENAEPVWKNADCDNDGVINADDPAPLNPDRDGDGDLDGSDTDADDPCSWSENQDPANAEPAWTNLDCDNDGLSNGEEVDNYGTDPRNEDTDGDGYSDPIEIRENSDPTDPNSKPDDCDGDFDPDSTDPDDDNDGVLDEEDAFICDPNRTVFLPTPSDYFTPNNDGFYDTWEVYKINEFPNNRVFVYTRNGQLIFSKNNYTNDWDGIGNDGKNIPEGSYFYQVDIDGDNQIDLQGWIYIAR